MPELVVDFPGVPAVDVRQCGCGTCNNTFFVIKPAGPTEKWMPSFCPFCGTHFDLMDIDGDPAVFEPKPV